MTEFDIDEMKSTPAGFGRGVLGLDLYPKQRTYSMNSGINMDGLKSACVRLMVAGSLVSLFLLLLYVISRLSLRVELSSLPRTPDSWTNRSGPRWKATEESSTTSSGISDTSCFHALGNRCGFTFLIELAQDLKRIFNSRGSREC